LCVPEEVMQALINYSWPGNIRALRHAVERAVIMATAEQLSLADFSLAAQIATPSPLAALSDDGDLNLERAEKQMITRALSKYSWNISLAAKELGLTRASLYRRMEKHGL
jgi:transcriptional regulator of acetoin/glycerol metabolism